MDIPVLGKDTVHFHSIHFTTHYPEIEVRHKNILSLRRSLSRC
jgi:hypothetical protein